MNDIDLDRLGEVWRERPDESEILRMQRTTAEVQRKARRAQIFETGSAIAAACFIVLMVFLNPAMQTILAGSAAITMLLVSSIRQRRLRKLELQSLTGSAEEMLDQAISTVEARLKRVRFGIVAIPPSFLIGFFLAVAINDSGGRVLPDWGTADLRQIGIAILVSFAMILTIIHLLQTYRRNHGELLRLRSVREGFQLEDSIPEPSRR